MGEGGSSSLTACVQAIDVGEKKGGTDEGKKKGKGSDSCSVLTGSMWAEGKGEKHPPPSPLVRLKGKGRKGKRKEGVAENAHLP